MAKSKHKKPANLNPRIENRRARHDYHILEKLETGIVLQGTEVKSIRLGQVSLAEGFARVDPRSGELYLHNVEIAPYPHAGINQHGPKQSRKLLAHKREIDKLAGFSASKGTTLIPLAIYFVRGKAKLELGVAEGKKTHDKRQDIKKRDADRDMRRAMTRKKI
ncbi:SsrA-binding protein SmpB [Phycisphaerales bacterium AB-hyl4]|uniref:SsrA-binding protein n=1 Tax=Natronomicrosphaera hydrolytica TaxID=3242702 RepID=A0ABV4U902_9BACT